MGRPETTGTPGKPSPAFFCPEEHEHEDARGYQEARRPLMEQLIAHLVGDYVLQSDWMAQNKTKYTSVALVHAFVYTAPFLLLTHSLAAVLVICLTHAVIDRYRLARYVVWTKEWLSPSRPRPLAECPLGYDPEKPPWLSMWLLIIADNTLHMILNYLALRYL